MAKAGGKDYDERRIFKKNENRKNYGSTRKICHNI